MLLALQAIASVLSAVPPYQRDRVAGHVLAGSFIPPLLEIFRQCEDLEDSSSLAALYRIVRGMVLLNDTAVSP